MEEDVKKSNREEVLEHRQAIMKNLILRLHAGDDYEQIKEEFKEHFATVSALEISMMERRLIEQGIAVEEIQRLCSIHADLFSDAVTSGERETRASNSSAERRKRGHRSYARPDCAPLGKLSG